MLPHQKAQRVLYFSLFSMEYAIDGDLVVTDRRETKMLWLSRTGRLRSTFWRRSRRVSASIISYDAGITHGQCA
jgi:hypothetical protein